jgi:hypothetical protein
MLLVDTHQPPPSPPPPPPRPNRTWPRTLLRLSWRLIAGLALVLLSGAFPPIEAYALLIAACVLLGRGFAAIVQSTPGLKDYHQ